MPNPETKTVMQKELSSIAREARTSLSLTQEEAAARLDVTKGSISRAENDGSGRFLRLQRRIIEELAGWKLRGPLWEVKRSS